MVKIAVDADCPGDHGAETKEAVPPTLQIVDSDPITKGEPQQ